jgi:hypothetical protein
MLRILRFAKISKMFRVLKMSRIFKRLNGGGINPGVIRLLVLVLKVIRLKSTFLIQSRALG